MTAGGFPHSETLGSKPCWRLPLEPANAMNVAKTLKDHDDTDFHLVIHVYGANMDKGLVLDGLKLKSVTIGQDGYTMDDVLVHDAHEKDNTLHMMLAMMSGDMPIALGVIRDVEGPTYDEAVHQQIEEVQAKNPTRKLHDLLMKGEIWEVK